MAERFVYRGKELKRLREAYEEAGRIGFQVRFIVGETGTGKTVLLNQFTEWIGQEETGALVTRCNCSDRGIEEEYQPFRDIFQSIVEELESVEEEKQSRKEKWSRVFGASADVLLKVAPDLIRSFVPMGGLLTSVGAKVLEGSGVQQKVEKMKEGDGLRKDVMRLADQYVEVLKLIAGRYRLVICMDNLQWADRSSVELLQRLTGMLRRLPVLVVGCYREADMVCINGKERLPLEAFVTRMKVEKGDVFVDLDEGSREEKRRFTDLLLDLDRNGYTEEFREEMFRRTGGNPLFVRELVRVLKENGSLTEGSDTGWQEAEVLKWEVFPLRIEGVVREKVAVLEEVQVGILTVAGVQGQVFLLPVLARMVNRGEEELLQELTEVLGKQRHLVEEEDCCRVNGHVIARFSFSDAFLRDYLYRRIGKLRRMKLHEEVGRLLESLYEGKTMEVCDQLAFHYEQAGECARACKYLRMVVKRLYEAGRYREVCVDCRRGIELAETEEDRCFYRFWQLKAMRRSGNFPVDRLEEMYRQLGSKEGVEGCLLWERWWIYMLEGDLTGALHWLLVVKGEKGGCYAVVAEGVTYYWLGEFERARVLLEGAKVTEDEEVAAWCGLYLMLCRFHDGEYERAEDLLTELKTGAKQGVAEIVALAGVWLAFLDEDKERMREETGRWKKDGGKPDFVGKWMMFFEAVCREEGEIWNRLEQLKRMYKATGCKYGITLYGLAVCRLGVEKGLYEVLNEVWREMKPGVDKRKEKCYWGELCLLRAAALESGGNSAEAGRWMEEARRWMRACGEKRFISGMEEV